MQPNTIKRSDKGPIAPPPRLRGAAQRVADAVQRLPGVVAQAHWEIGSYTVVNGTDFYVGEEELGHIHLDAEAHIPLGAHLADVVIKASLASRFAWSRDFVAVHAGDDGVALLLFSLRRDQIDGVDSATLCARIEDQARHRR